MEKTTSELLVNVPGYEGPFDVLLTLAQKQKVDLEHISIVLLVDQYLAFIEEAKKIRLELAADYMVMAAWLAFLKSRLLLPPEEQEETQEIAEKLTYHLDHLQRIKAAASELGQQIILGDGRFPRGMPAPPETIFDITYTMGVAQLIRSYAGVKKTINRSDFLLKSRNVYSIQDALQRLGNMVKKDWSTLESFMPELDENQSSGMASLFVAGLEMARNGKVMLKQRATYDPIYIKAL